jgi:hypothetical protein
MDDPNRQAVGLDPAWVEGNGATDNVGVAGLAAESAKAKAPTKAELLEEAEARGLDVNESNTKAEIEEALASG